MKPLYFLFILLVWTPQVAAQTQLPRFFNDGMVIQREKPINIWGWAEPGAKIRINFADQSKSVKTNKGGEWQIELTPLPANSQPQKMVISGPDTTITIKNILIGDVWVCSGQSNMNYIIERFPYAQTEAEKANFPKIRMTTIEKAFSVKEANDCQAGPWLEATGTNIYGFSATAYFFGRELFQKLGIPIGLIATSWGGTNVESWMPPHSLADFPVLDSIYKERQTAYLSQSLEAKELERQRLINSIVKTGIGITEGWYQTDYDIADWRSMTIPMEKDNAIFAKNDGALWLKKHFEVPTPFRGKDLKVNLGQINDYSKVWVNGHEIGESDRDTKWRNHTIKKEWLIPGSNQITVRVFDYNGSGGWITDPYNINIHPVGDSRGFYLLSGDWQFKTGKILSEPLSLPKTPDRVFRLTQTIPGCLYNQMIHPLTKLSISGAIWYQGESNALRGFEYSQFFPSMISGWRKAFNQGDFPFFFVQLPNFDAKPRGSSKKRPNWAELRHAQAQGLQLPRTGMAVTLDVGEAKDVHPKNKQEVGKRLALNALGIHYQLDVPYKAPAFDKMKIEGDYIQVSFANTGEGLVNTNESFMGPLLHHFEIADQKGQFFPAKAKITDQETISVWSEQVKAPLHVRYAWKNNPENINFFNSYGLPVAPFRTDQWEWETRSNTYLKGQ